MRRRRAELEQQVEEQRQGAARHLLHPVPAWQWGRGGDRDLAAAVAAEDQGRAGVGVPAALEAQADVEVLDRLRLEPQRPVAEEGDLGQEWLPARVGEETQRRQLGVGNLEPRRVLSAGAGDLANAQFCGAHGREQVLGLHLTGDGAGEEEQAAAACNPAGDHVGLTQIEQAGVGQE
ncbi:MAG: hypothetical protein ACPGQD_08190 [Planctomycetota bacterium]